MPDIYDMLGLSDSDGEGDDSIEKRRRKFLKGARQNRLRAGKPTTRLLTTAQPTELKKKKLKQPTLTLETDNGDAYALQLEKQIKLHDKKKAAKEKKRQSAAAVVVEEEEASSSLDTPQTSSEPVKPAEPIKPQAKAERKQALEEALQQLPDERTIYVGGISFDAEEEDLKELLEEQIGLLEALVFPRNNSGRPAGYAYAVFVDAKDISKIKTAQLTLMERSLKLSLFNQKVLLKRNIKPKEMKKIAAKQREKRKAKAKHLSEKAQKKTKKGRK